MNVESIILMVVRSLGTLGQTFIETLLCKVDDIVCKSDSELDNELWLNVLMPALKKHTSTCPPPKNE